MTRGTAKDKRHFLLIAKGSCAELRTQIYTGTDIGYIDKANGCRWTQETREIAALLSGLIGKLSNE